MSDLDLSRFHDAVMERPPIRPAGRVMRVAGLTVEASGPPVPVGGLCRLEPGIRAEAVGFREGRLLLMPLEPLQGVYPGGRVFAEEAQAGVPVGEGLLGRVLDGLGAPTDDRGPIRTEGRYPLYADAVNPLLRRRIREPLETGVRAIDALTTLGRGQRMGIFAGSGVGKSALLGMIARNCAADVNVVALIGERGRELNDFLERDLGPEGMARSVVVVATSDQPALIRMRAAWTAAAVAEYFRDRGRQVLLMMDSLTRFAMAGREVGLAAGEPPTSKGYTPSIFAALPRLLERAGNGAGPGGITGLYTVLVEGDDPNEPIADAARGILDGHLWLTRELAARNHYPAIDVLESVSRTMPDTATPEHRALAGRLRSTLAVYRRAEDLIAVGAYSKGGSREIDEAIRRIDRINAFLRQDMAESSSLADTMKALEAIFA
ncbi:MAG: FliI/YscN family ATPase [Desulfococcaceae bacterium]